MTLFFSSVRSRLLWVLVPLLAISLAVTAALIYFMSRSELGDALDAQLELLTDTSAAAWGDHLNQPNTNLMSEELQKHRLNYLGDFLLVVRDAAGNELFHSTPDVILPADLTSGVHKLKINDQRWHLAVRETSDGKRFHITGRVEEEAREVALQLVGTAVLPISVVFTLALLASVVCVQAGLLPLTKLSEHLQQRPIDKLDRIDPSEAPKEIMPIIQALNELFTRIESFLKRERQFIDDAAHEIRTPLTVIKAQAQALDPASLDADSSKRVVNILTGIDRVTRLSNQLLQQTKAEAEAGLQDVVNLRQTIVGLISEFDELATRHSVTLEVEWDSTRSYECKFNHDDLWTILRNLIENAIRHAGNPGTVRVTIRREADSIVILVEDTGSGVPIEERDKIFQRFYRSRRALSANQAPHPEGVGLGLSIAKTLAVRNGALLSIDQSGTLGGAEFWLRVFHKDTATSSKLSITPAGGKKAVVSFFNS